MPWWLWTWSLGCNLQRWSLGLTIDKKTLYTITQYTLWKLCKDCNDKKNISLIQCLCLTVETWDSIFHLMFWAFSTLNKIASYNNVDRATAAKLGVETSIYCPDGASAIYWNGLIFQKCWTILKLESSNYKRYVIDKVQKCTFQINKKFQNVNFP